MNIEKLTRTLTDFYQGKIPEKEALKAVKSANPLEISIAEQNLLKRGIMTEKELKEFCKIHLKVIEEKIQEIKSRLEEGHPIRVLISEHEEIQEFLDELEELGKSLNGKLGNTDRKKLQKLAHNIVESETHHEREEETIFPRLEAQGVTDPPRIMRQDHEKFKSRKKRLLNLSKAPEKHSEEIKELIDFLAFELRDHIFKENNILYPTALEELEDWDIIRKEGDKIGYCTFVPIQSNEAKG